MEVEKAVEGLTKIVEKDVKQVGNLIKITQKLVSEITVLEERISKLEGKNGNRKVHGKKV